MRFNETDNEQTPAKNAFHTRYKKVLREVAKRLGLEKGQYDVRSNLGGPAVLGEVTLHTDTLYVSLGEHSYYRSCVGRKDYVGGVNRSLRLEDLVYDLNTWVEAFKVAASMSGKERRY